MDNLFIKNENGRSVLFCGEKPVFSVIPCDNATDSFEKIDAYAWRWTRKTALPVREMKMELETVYEAAYTMVPAVNYNGNGWGDSVEYTGDSCGGIPWKYAYHRTVIPACTYSEGDGYACALMAEADDEESCSLYKTENGRERHSLIWPEEEGPKVLYRHEWAPTDFMGNMEPRSEFNAIMMAFPVVKPRHQIRTVLDFAWRYYAHPMKGEFSCERLWKLSVAFMKSLWTLEKDGFVAFNRGLQWYKSTCFYAKRDAIKYELGWVGQSASASNALLQNYLRTKDKDSLEKAVSCLDAWVKFSKIDNGTGLHKIKFDGAPTDQERVIPLDSCNLGQGAYQYFEAADVMEKLGMPKPEYVEFAMDICDFAVRAQSESGEFAKSWNEDGTVNQQEGTIGCFLIPPLLTAYRRTGDKKYLCASVRAFDCYFKELSEYGFTTAGALDTYCIDKESSSPLLSAAIDLYEVTGDKKYVSCAEDIAWYLSTWMMHYSVRFPKESSLYEIGYDSLGATAVSTAHNAIDQYALHDVVSFIKLGEITGNTQWKERALAFWYGASQLVSDGTLCILGRVRPAGSQDEAVFHTRWGRPGLNPFNPSNWLVMWPCAFRMEILRYFDDWELLDGGLNKIEGKI